MLSHPRRIGRRAELWHQEHGSTDIVTIPFSRLRKRHNSDLELKVSDLMSIRAIDLSSVHRLTSGQVVIDLQTAVKELVENSLDANATSIEVRFKNYGLKSVEVIDNGHGIREEDYENIALKHHTSKLSSYTDLATVQTYGFRGEALSSLCALSSSLTVVTATAEQAPMGTVLEFREDGKLKSPRGKTARNKGTTIIISELFKPLPVRRKEFERNLKREFGKALSILHAYALVPCSKENNGVRLVVTNQQDKGSRSVQFQIDGSSSLEASVSSLWGPKTLVNLVPLNLAFPVAVDRFTTLKKRGSQQEIIPVEVRGLISKFSSGCGRTNTDRQFFFVNGRPCVLSKIQKVLNEIYRSFNSGQVPFVIADFCLPTEACDINVSPDKRSIFLHSEDALIQALKRNLEDAFSSSRSTYSVNNTLSSSSSTADTKGSPAVLETTGLSSNVDHTKKSLPLELERNEDPVVVDLTDEPSSFVPSTKAVSIHKMRQKHTVETLDTSKIITSSGTELPLIEDLDIEGSTGPPKKRLKMDVTGKEESRTSKSSHLVLDTKSATWNVRRPNDTIQHQSSRPGRVPSTSSTDTETSEHRSLSSESEDINLTRQAKVCMIDPPVEDRFLEDSRHPTKLITSEETSDSIPQGRSKHIECPTEGNDQPHEPKADFGRDVSYIPQSGSGTPISSQQPVVTEIVRTTVSRVRLKLDLKRLRSIWQRPSHLGVTSHNDVLQEISDSFEKHAGINNDVKEAEEVLTRVIHKEDFGYMRIIGQFNRGFLITRLMRIKEGMNRVDDLFIVDQHAADEKYNFESLQQSTKMDSQKLLRPQSIELASAEELILIDNMHVLQENGFEIAIQEDARPGSGNRIQLMSQPISKDTIFNLDDLTELLHLIQEKSGNRMVRCSKARAMFAMRACRKSVMIGMPLTAKQMISIIRNMGSMDQPWHCPHGRPTMRHLANLHSFSRPERNISWTNLNLPDYPE